MRAIEIVVVVVMTMTMMKMMMVVVMWQWRWQQQQQQNVILNWLPLYVNYTPWKIVAVRVVSLMT